MGGPANTETQYQAQSPVRALLPCLQDDENPPASPALDGSPYARLLLRQSPTGSPHPPAARWWCCSCLSENSRQWDGSAAGTKHRTRVATHNRAGPPRPRTYHASRQQVSTNAGTTHTSLRTAPVRGLQQCSVPAHRWFQEKCPHTPPSSQPVLGRAQAVAPLRCHSSFSERAHVALVERRHFRTHGRPPPPA